MMCDVAGSSSHLEDEIRRLKEEMEQLKISAAEATEAKVEAEQEMGLAKQEAEAAKQDAEAAEKARAEAEKAESQAQLIPVPARFQFAFGRPEVLEERRAERLAKWQWSSQFISKARPDKGNYGAGDFFDDGLTKLERQQIEGGREAYLTGAAKLRYKRLTGQI